MPYCLRTSLVEVEHQFLQPMLNDYPSIVAWDKDFGRIVEKQIESSVAYAKIFYALFTALGRCESQAPSLLALVKVNLNKEGSKEPTVKACMASEMMDKSMESYSI